MRNLPSISMMDGSLPSTSAWKTGVYDNPLYDAMNLSLASSLLSKHTPKKKLFVFLAPLSTIYVP